MWRVRSLYEAKVPEVPRDGRAEYDGAVTIRTATAADAAVVADLARRTFYDTFASTNNPDDMALYLAEAFGVDQQTRELSDRDITALLVEQDGVPVAYAMVRGDHVPECVTGPAPLELWRFYVDRGWHGRGIAQALMERVRQAARERGARTLWLGVWERNDRARAFYAKCGFTDAGNHIFLFGTDPQTDMVMVTSI
jgi:ribosomal protein S18 acetylase RimI-like enzyme